MYIECININKNINQYYQLYKTVNEKNSNINNMLVLYYLWGVYYNTCIIKGDSIVCCFIYYIIVLARPTMIIGFLYFFFYQKKILYIIIIIIHTFFHFLSRKDILPIDNMYTIHMWNTYHIYIYIIQHYRHYQLLRCHLINLHHFYLIVCSYIVLQQ